MVRVNRRLWTADEVRLAVALYVQTPFGRIHSRNPEIVDLSNTIERTPSSVALKLANLASLDETLPQVGMQNASILDREIWAEFFRALFAESKTLPNTTEGLSGFHEGTVEEYVYDGTSLDRFGITKQRSRQDFFRTMVLSAYDFRCAVTGIEQPELLVAGHIKPWALEVDRRLDPTNGICLNRLHDHAFDCGLITFEDDGCMVMSSQLKPDTREKMLQLAIAPTLKMPRRFLPDRELLRFHREQVFRGGA